MAEDGSNTGPILSDPDGTVGSREGCNAGQGGCAGEKDVFQRRAAIVLGRWSGSC